MILQVLILNSGYARRLQPLTNTTHKALLRVNGISILERQMNILTAFGLENYIITTGPFADQIQATLSRGYPGVHIQYVHNPEYASTNYIYSMWLTRSFILEDVLLLHGDLVFQPSVAKKMIDQHHSSVIVDPNSPLPEKDFKGLIQSGTVRKIGVDVFDQGSVFLLPFYYWKYSDFHQWMESIDQFIARHQISCYAENAFNSIADQLKLYPVALKKEICMEIDTKEDLALANDLFRKFETKS